jgi:hypothetical protein
LPMLISHSVYKGMGKWLAHRSTAISGQFWAARFEK